ncbi:MAG: preprotein translocase subunit SecY [Phycisphaerales bacterium]|mgnify:CR=1 FL=1|jgi:preprotein translocase subunit SecY|nr:preprotein translocase subunit SecY [Phycisphaerales bacterium]|tara:strand:+ start:1974 stop:3359 length:1386 start_codon:yes stop_codon:yes gene_type:complete
MFFQTLINVFRIPELRNKILFTLGMLAVYRIGFWIPVPGVDQGALTSFFEQQAAAGSAAGRLSQYVAIFSGGSFGQSTIFGLGIMPYITASIIFQLFQGVSPQLKKLKDEGPTGYAKIQEWTRYATVGLCLVQAVGWLTYITKSGLVYEAWAHNPLWWVMGVTALTAGTIFLMWLGEQIDRFGIGNGVSLIIMAGILTGMPGAVMSVIGNFDAADPNKMGWMGLILLLFGFVLIVAGSVLLTVAQRRIPVQQAKHTRGNRTFGGQKSYLPLKVNHGGVMPIIFASSLMVFPSVVFSALMDQAQNANATGTWVNIIAWLSSSFQMGTFPYVFLYIIMVYFFSYFWITVQFNPEEMSKQLRDHGSFIPGLRPGPRTAEYLEAVMERITYVGAAFLAVIAVLPMVVNSQLKVDFVVSQFLGGTGLLIVVSVALDFLQRVEANLLMRNYDGFLGDSDAGEGRSRS